MTTNNKWFKPYDFDESPNALFNWIDAMASVFANHEFLSLSQANSMIRNEQPINENAIIITAKIVAPIILFPHDLDDTYTGDEDNETTMCAIIKTYNDDAKYDRLVEKLELADEEDAIDNLFYLKKRHKKIDPKAMIYHELILHDPYIGTFNTGKMISEYSKILRIGKSVHILNAVEIEYLKEKFGVESPLF
jgi:hypothetical protein